MTLTQKIHLRAIVASRGDASPHLHDRGDAVLVERGRPRLLVLLCPCGCGEEFPINLDSRSGPAWRLYRGAKAGLSLFPSVWRENGCKSHYIIWHDKILLFGRYDEDYDDSLQNDEFLTLREAVLGQLPSRGFMKFSEIADKLDEVPWDVLAVCRQLVRNGQAREGLLKDRGSFLKL